MKHSLLQRYLFVTLYLLLAGMLACCSSSQLAGNTSETDDASVEGGLNNESRHTKFSSYSKLDETDQTSYTDIHAYIRSHVTGLDRGPGSVNFGGSPIYVVDGIQMESIDGMSPIDVYSVEYIKDASASIYGFRGVNGVINIVTKSAHTQAVAEAAAKKAARTAKKAERAARKTSRTP